MIDPLSTPRCSIFSLSDRRDNDLLDEVTRSPATHALEQVSWLPERELQRRKSKMFERLRKGVDPGPFSDDCSCSDRKLYKKSTKNEVFDMSGMFAASQSVEGTSEFPHIGWTTLKEEENYSFASRRSTSYPNTCLAPPLTPQPSRRFPRSSSTSSLTSSLGKRRRRSKVSESKRLMRSIALGANLSLLEDDSCSSLIVEPAAILLAVPAPTDEEEEKQQRDPPVVPSRDFRSSASKTVNECLKMLGEDLNFSPTNVSSPVQSNMFWYQDP